MDGCAASMFKTLTKKKKSSKKTPVFFGSATNPLSKKLAQKVLSHPKYRRL
jgi:hypothetical protein